jgi:hypothetical protein
MKSIFTICALASFSFLYLSSDDKANPQYVVYAKQAVEFLHGVVLHLV